MSLIKVPVLNEDGQMENLEVSGLGTFHEDSQYINIFSLATLKKRYFLSYLFGLVCAYIPPISYLLNNPNSSFQVMGTNKVFGKSNRPDLQDLDTTFHLGSYSVHS